MSNSRQPALRVVAIRRPFARFEPRPWQPPLNIYETEQGIQLVADLAGIAPDDLDVSVLPTAVQIQGTRRVAPPSGPCRIQRLEIAGGPFQAQVPLPRPIDPDRAAAQYTDGLLSIWLPLAERPAQRVAIIQRGEEGAQ